jgi:FlaA1/EpsC-like NDP-sugar epimerase
MRAAAAVGVERFVLVSTDKAVDPSSVMGATKRLSEMAVASSDGHYVSVRFGNVLGSSGSLVPLLLRQLRQGHPLTITDPDMTRYFMLVEEAAALILVASVTLPTIWQRSTGRRHPSASSACDLARSAMRH